MLGSQDPLKPLVAATLPLLLVPLLLLLLLAARRLSGPNPTSSRQRTESFQMPHVGGPSDAGRGLVSARVLAEHVRSVPERLRSYIDSGNGRDPADAAREAAAAMQAPAAPAPQAPLAAPPLPQPSGVGQSRPDRTVTRGSGALSQYVSDNMNDAGDAMADYNDNICKLDGYATTASGMLRSLYPGKCALPTLVSDALKEPGGCSKKNASLYSSRFADIVLDIAQQEGGDALPPGVSKCVVTFDAGGDGAIKLRQPNGAARLREYDAFLNDRAVEISAEYKELYDVYQTVQREYDELYKKYLSASSTYVTKVAERDTCRNVTLPNAKAELDTKLAEIAAGVAAGAADKRAKFFSVFSIKRR